MLGSSIKRATYNSISNVEIGVRPNDISGLGLWFDSTDPLTVLNSTGPDVPATNNQTITRWLDKSANGFHANQAVIASRPLYVVNSLNGKPVTQWDGSDDRLVATLPNFTTCTIFQVHRSSKTALQMWLSDTSTNNRYALTTQQGSSATTVTSNFGTPTFRRNGVPVTYANRGVAYTSLVTNNPIILTTVGADVSSWNKTANNLSFGYSTIANGPGGAFAEFIMYSGTLAINNIRLIEAYLANKYGVVLG